MEVLDGEVRMGMVALARSVKASSPKPMYPAR